MTEDTKTEDLSLIKLEKRLIEKALTLYADQGIHKVASVLGICKRTVYRKCHEHGIKFFSTYVKKKK